ncbi:unnamed protein product [Amoebophrya sp. A120]|nr:unnamed protein product [Amoebophrya sp. A120]|eukprot:GSA120T00017133001.1
MRKFYRRKKYAFEAVTGIATPALEDNVDDKDGADKDMNHADGTTNDAEDQKFKLSSSPGSSSNSGNNNDGGGDKNMELAVVSTKKADLHINEPYSQEKKQMRDWFEKKRSEFLNAIFDTKGSMLEGQEKEAFMKAKDMMTHRGVPDILPSEHLVLEALWLMVWDCVLPDPEEETEGKMLQAMQADLASPRDANDPILSKLKQDAEDLINMQQALKIGKSEVVASLLAMAEEELPASVLSGKASLVPNIESSPVRGQATLVRPSAIASPSAGQYGARIKQSPAPNTTNAMEDSEGGGGGNYPGINSKHASKNSLRSDKSSAAKRRKLMQLSRRGSKFNETSGTRAVDNHLHDATRSKKTASVSASAHDELSKHIVPGRKQPHPDKDRLGLLCFLDELSDSDEEDLEPADAAGRVMVQSSPNMILDSPKMMLGAAASGRSGGVTTDLRDEKLRHPDRFLLPPASKARALAEGPEKLLQLLVDVAKHHKLRPKQPRRKNLLLTAMELLCKRAAEQIQATQQATKLFSPLEGMTKIYAHLIAKEIKNLDQHPEVKKHWGNLIAQLYKEYNPQKLESVPELLVKYHNKERLLYLGICDKYQVQPRSDLPEEIKARVNGDAITPGMAKPNLQPHFPLNNNDYGAAGAPLANGMNNAGNNTTSAMANGTATGSGSSATSGDDQMNNANDNNERIFLDEMNDDYFKEFQELYFSELVKLYERFNPMKIDKIRPMLEKNRTREQLLFEGVCDKYEIKQTDEFALLNLPLQRKIAVLKIKHTIKRIFELKNPEKLSTLQTVMQKYHGKEEKLYTAVCTKYSVSENDLLIRELKQCRDNAEKKENNKEEKLDKEIGTKNKDAADKDPLTAKERKKQEKQRTEKLKAAIKDIYKQKNPSKTKELSKTIFPKYLNREHELYTALCKKYDIPVDKKLLPTGGTSSSNQDNADGDFGPQVAMKAAANNKDNNNKAGTTTSNLPPDNSDEEHSAAKPDSGLDYEKLIYDLYKEHNPTKLEDLPALLQKYEGQQDELYERVCKKYNVEPIKPQLQSPAQSSVADPSEAPEDELKGPFDDDPKYLQYALDVLCILLRSLSNLFHMNANLHLPYNQSATMLKALQKQKEVVHKKNDRSYKSLYKSSWDLSVLPPDQLRDLQLALKPRKMRELEDKLGSRVFLSYQNDVLELKGSNKQQMDQAILLVSRLLDDINGDSDLESDKDYGCDESTTCLYTACTETYHGDDVLPMYVNRQNILLDIRTPFDHLRHKYSCSIRFDYQEPVLPAELRDKPEEDRTPIEDFFEDGITPERLMALQKEIHEDALLPLFKDEWLRNLNAKKMRMKGGIVFNLEFDRRANTLALIAVAKSKVALDRIADKVGEALEHGAKYQYLPFVDRDKLKEMSVGPFGPAWIRTDVHFPPPVNQKAIRSYHQSQHQQAIHRDVSYTSDEFEPEHDRNEDTTAPDNVEDETLLDHRPLKLTRQMIFNHIQKQKARYENTNEVPMGDDKHTKLNIRNLIDFQTDTLHDWGKVKQRLDNAVFDPTAEQGTKQSIRERRAWKYCSNPWLEKKIEENYRENAVCVNCHEFGHTIEECDKPCRFTKVDLANAEPEDRTEDALYRRVEEAVEKLASWRTSDTCVTTRFSMFKMQQLLHKLKQWGGVSVEALRRMHLPPEKITALVDEITVLSQSGLVFPAEVDPLCQALLKNPMLLHDQTSLTNAQNYKGQRDAFGGRQPPLPVQPLSEFRKEQGIPDPLTTAIKNASHSSSSSSGPGGPAGTTTAAASTAKTLAPTLSPTTTAAAASSGDVATVHPDSPNKRRDSLFPDFYNDDDMSSSDEEDSFLIPSLRKKEGEPSSAKNNNTSSSGQVNDQNAGNADNNNKNTGANTKPLSDLKPEPPIHGPPPVPISDWKHVEKIFLEDYLQRYLYGANVMSRILGRGGGNHKLMEQESGTRIYFRGVGISPDLRKFPELDQFCNDSSKMIWDDDIERDRHNGRVSITSSVLHRDGTITSRTQTEYADSEKRLHMLVRAESPEQVVIVKKKLKEIMENIDLGLQVDARIQDVFNTSNQQNHDQGGRNSGNNLPAGPEHHPFYPMVPFEAIYTTEVPVREIKKDWKFQFPASEEFKPLAAKIDRFCKGYSKEVDNFVQFAKTFAEEQQTLTQQQDAAAQALPDVDKKNPNAEVDEDGEENENNGSGTTTSATAAKKMTKKQREKEQQENLLKELEEPKDLVRTNWFGKPQLRSEFQNNIFEIPGLDLPDFEACGDPEFNDIINAFIAMLSDWQRPYWFEPNELIATQSLVHGPVEVPEEANLLKLIDQAENANSPTAGGLKRTGSSNRPGLSGSLKGKAASTLLAALPKPKAAMAKPAGAGAIVKRSNKLPPNISAIVKKKMKKSRKARRNRYSNSCFANSLLAGHHVALSDAAVDRFARVLFQSGLLPSTVTSFKQVADGLRAARGVVRCEKHDEELLMMMKYPWAVYSDLHKSQSVKDKVGYPSGLADVHKELKMLGRKAPVEIVVEEEGALETNFGTAANSKIGPIPSPHASPRQSPKTGAVVPAKATGAASKPLNSPQMSAAPQVDKKITATTMSETTLALQRPVGNRKTQLCYYGYLVDWRLPNPPMEQNLYAQEHGLDALKIDQPEAPIIPQRPKQPVIDQQAVAAENLQKASMAKAVSKAAVVDPPAAAKSGGAQTGPSAPAGLVAAGSLPQQGMMNNNNPMNQQRIMNANNNPMMNQMQNNSGQNYNINQPMMMNNQQTSNMMMGINPANNNSNLPPNPIQATSAKAPALLMVEREKQIGEKTGITAKLVDAGAAQNIVVLESEREEQRRRQEELAKKQAELEQKRKAEEEKKRKEQEEAEKKKRAQAEIAALAMQAINPNKAAETMNKPSETMNNSSSAGSSSSGAGAGGPPGQQQNQQDPTNTAVFQIEKWLNDEQKQELQKTIELIKQCKGKHQTLQNMGVMQGKGQLPGGMTGEDALRKIQEYLAQQFIKLRTLKGAAASRQAEIEREEQRKKGPLLMNQGPQMQLLKTLVQEQPDRPAIDPRQAALAAANPTGPVLNFGGGGSSASSSSAATGAINLVNNQQPASSSSSSRPVSAAALLAGGELGRQQFTGNVFLPPETFPARDLHKKIAGEDDAYFKHILTKWPGTGVTFHGLAHAQAPADNRLKIIVSSTDPDMDKFKEAFSNVVDLAATVTTVVLRELGVPDDERERIKKSMRTEMFSIDANGTQKKITKADSDEEDTVESDATVQDDESPVAGGNNNTTNGMNQPGGPRPSGSPNFGPKGGGGNAMNKGGANYGKGGGKLGGGMMNNKTGGGGGKKGGWW